MEFVELDELTRADWAGVVAGEHEPFGPEGGELAWREKERHFALRAGDGRLRALAATVPVAIEIDGARSFEVVGLGGVIVTRAERGRGLMAKVVEPVLSLAREMGPDHAMLFCHRGLVPVYGRLGFSEITAAVWAEQSRGPVKMPMCAMWLALRAGATWPAGRVDVLGLPF
jgi:predicted GNAT family N-acyltransferase